jgi:hypothetical protein
MCIADPEVLQNCDYVPRYAQQSHAESETEKPKVWGIISLRLYGIGSQGNRTLKRMTVSSASYWDRIDNAICLCTRYGNGTSFVVGLHEVDLY